MTNVCVWFIVWDMNVGFIGLGLMGMPMAKNILKAGYPLAVYNRTKSKADELGALGAHVQHSPENVAEASDLVITMVTAPGDVETILFGEHGVVHGYHEGLVVCDMSTIGPTAARTIAEKLKGHSIGFVDAPVTGSTPKAISGELTVFVGGDDATVRKIMPVLRAVGKDIHHVGEVSKGQAIKMVNNYIIAATIATAAESMKLADSMNLPRGTVAEVLGTTPTVSGIMNLKLSNFVTDSYPLLFTMKNMLKDVTLAQSERKPGENPLPVLSLIKKLYERAVRYGLAMNDFSEIIKILT